MPTSIAACARLLGKLGLRHHVDADESVIWLVIATREYMNLRGERLAVVGLETPDDGRRVRVRISRAFAPGDDPARTCLALCRVAADAPLVAVQFDADRSDLRLVVETAVEDGAISASQVAAMIDRLVEAAEAWAPLVASLPGQPPARSSVTKRKRGAA
jgi:hypothetical protein